MSSESPVTHDSDLQVAFRHMASLIHGEWPRHYTLAELADEFERRSSRTRRCRRSNASRQTTRRLSTELLGLIKSIL